MIAQNRSIATQCVRHLSRFASRHIVTIISYITSQHRSAKFERLFASYALAIAVGASAAVLPKLPSIYVLPSEQTHVVKQVGDHRWPAKHVAKPTRSTVIVRPAQHPAKAEQCREDEPCDVTVNTEELLAQ